MSILLWGKIYPTYGNSVTQNTYVGHGLNVCHQVKVLNNFFVSFSNPLDKCNDIKIILVTCTSLHGQARLTTIRAISISVIRCPREMISLLFPKFVLANKFNEIEISSATCTVDTVIKMVSIGVKQPWPTRSRVHVTKLILISLNLSTEKTYGTKIIIFLAPVITEIGMVKRQASLTIRANGARDKAIRISLNLST